MTSIHRKSSTAFDLHFPMYIISLHQLQRMYGGKEPRYHRMDTHQILKHRGELIQWQDLPFDANIIFVSHEWVGWNHPDPQGIQLKVFLRVMERLRTGEIDQVEMNVFHTMIYKTNHVVSSNKWKELLSTAYVNALRG